MKPFFLGLGLVLTLTSMLSGCGNSDTSPSSAPAKTQAEAHDHAGEGGHKEDGSKHSENGSVDHDDHEKGESGHHEHGSHDEGGEGAERVRIAPAAAKTAGIVTSTIGSATIKENIELYGVVAPDAQRVRNIAARFPGVVRRVTKSWGDSVRSGETLATIESNESLQTYQLTAPISGIVTARNVNVGESAESQALFTITDLSRVWVELSLYPRDLARIRVGQDVRVRMVNGELTGTGKIIGISSLGSAQTQSRTARVQLENPDGRWTPGLYVQGEIAVSETSAAIAVPTTALQELEEGTSVFVEGDDGFEPRAVKTGRTDGESIEIVSGLNAGERVVTQGSFVLKAELGKGEAEHDH